MFSELRLLLTQIRNWSFEKRRLIGLLSVLSIGVLGISPGSRIPLEQAKRVLDIEEFERYPWGRVAFSSLVNSVKVISFEERNKYTLRGCVHALLIWVYESIPGIGEEYGNRIEGNQVPLLSWSASRCRINWDQFYKKEKNILHGELDDTYWNQNTRNAPVANKAKRKLASECEACVKKKMPKERTSDHDLIEAAKTLTSTVASMDKIVAEKVLTAVDTTIEAKVNARVGQVELVLAKQISTLKEDVAILREQMQAIAPKNDAHFVNQEDEVNSNDPVSSWMVQDKAPTHLDAAAVQCVVRKKAKNSEVKLTSHVLLATDGEKVVGKNQAKKAAGDLKTVKKEKNVVPQLRDSAETWSNSEDRNKYGKLDATLDQLAASFLDGPLQKRKPQLTKTQVYPYVGNSTVKRIITGVSKAYYDPLAKVDETKFKKLLDYLHNIAGDNDVDTHFYMRLITPRDDWETDESGWLTDSNMASAMLMFHKRHMKNPSPYSSSRIAFLDHWFVKSWARDYKTYDPKTWKFSDTYKKVFNGNYPTEFSNNRQWLKDVDRLFLCHLINGNHWVALEVDLLKKIIHVYDSIQTVVPSITDLQEECRPFMEMIPLLLNEMVPDRKKSSQQFKISRLKSVPKNKIPGDCGVYALKYIECKAIGCGFEGLSDQCIPSMRIKLAAEIYDEVSGL
uniref:Ubiquitin-like protease family profile domain-containing protein n=1 Tax=Brassica oleracea TaxID=3712 RepID=A0A3P6G3V8_BRAOL|nr:unnamed protein product [Brassica oleracea]